MSHPEPTRGYRPFGGWGARVYEGLGFLAGALLAIMVLAVFVQVLIRRFFMFSVDGIDELPRFLFVWIVMLGAASAMQRGEHTLLEYFRDKLSLRWNACCRLCVEAMGIFLFLTIIYVSFTLLPQGYHMESPGLGVRYSYIYGAMPVGAAFTIIPMSWRMAGAAREFLQTWRRHS
jgi:TRAP-type C4-dicarboxylate transport system permease small subunit